ncbi:hypothetical protein IFM89_014651 [Coptis chinensis]|uniref:Pentatricopeptide repeat-containing protein n=1 Tax=Coptis chinensis TaxID=261450 RepID=A0A835H2X7_9MAGN|nr:hypothetical protein IFM89_014651 [Coptis chinensis]
MAAIIGTVGADEAYMEMRISLDAIVRGVVDVVLGSDWNDDVKKKLGKMNVQLSENVLLEIFTALRGQPFKALFFFRWVEEHMGYTPNAVTYNGILKVLDKQNSIKEFWDVVKELKSTGHDIDSDTYIKLSRTFQRRMMLTDAVGLYELMMDGPYKPSVLHCGSLLRAISLADTPDLDLAFRVFNKFDEAEKFLDNMRNAGFEPTRQHHLRQHSVWVLRKQGGWRNKGRVDGAYSLVLETVKKVNMRPLLDTYKNLIQNLLGERKLKEALKLLRQMKIHEFPPFEEPFYDYISKFGMVDDVIDYFTEITLRPINLSKTTVTSFNNGHGSVMNLTEIQKRKRTRDLRERKHHKKRKEEKTGSISLEAVTQTIKARSFCSIPCPDPQLLSWASILSDFWAWASRISILWACSDSSIIRISPFWPAMFRFPNGHRDGLPYSRSLPLDLVQTDRCSSTSSVLSRHPPPPSLAALGGVAGVPFPCHERLPSEPRRP